MEFIKHINSLGSPVIFSYNATLDRVVAKSNTPVTLDFTSTNKRLGYMLGFTNMDGGKVIVEKSTTATDTINLRFKTVAVASYTEGGVKMVTTDNSESRIAPTSQLKFIFANLWKTYTTRPSTEIYRYTTNFAEIPKI